MFRPDGAHGFRRLYRKADAILERSAVFVGAPIAEGRKELVHEIAVGEVQFHYLKSGFECAAGGGRERLPNARDLGER